MSFHTLGPAGASLPSLCIEIDFTNDPTNPSRVWTDVTSDVRQLEYTLAGRTQELQRTEAGTLRATLSNRSGNYDPTNPSGAYYPGVRRRRWIRVRGQWGGVTYSRWQGLIQTWTQSWPGGGTDAITTIRAVDASMVLNLFDLAGQSFGSQRTDQRVKAVCDLAGLAYTLDTGSSTIDASGTFVSQSYSLPHLQQVELTENGLLFAGADGTINFQGRHWRLKNATIPVDTLGDGVGEIPYRQAEHEIDDGDLATVVTVTPNGGSPITVSDAAMETRYFAQGQSTIDRTLLTSSVTEATSCAQYLLNRYKESSPRIPQVDLIGARATSKWPEILGTANSQRFTWKRRAAAHTITEDVYVEKISETITQDSWTTTLELSPAVDQAGWVLGDAVNGLLGLTTILVY